MSSRYRPSYGQTSTRSWYLAMVTHRTSWLCGSTPAWVAWLTLPATVNVSSPWPCLLMVPTWLVLQPMNPSDCGRYSRHRRRKQRLFPPRQDKMPNSVFLRRVFDNKAQEMKGVIQGKKCVLDWCEGVYMILQMITLLEIYVITLLYASIIYRGFRKTFRNCAKVAEGDMYNAPRSTDLSVRALQIT